MKKFIAMALTLPALMTSCISHPVTDQDYAVTQLRTPRGVEVTVQNLSNRSICLAARQWPGGENGYIGMVSDNPVYMEGGRTFEFSRQFSAIGHMDHSTAIKPGAAYSHLFLYSDFTPEIERKDHADLVFDVVVRSCH